jgi:hypothetical protein
LGRGARRCQGRRWAASTAQDREKWYPGVEVVVEAGREGRGLEHEIALDDELAHELIGEQDRRTLPQFVGIC